MRWHVILALLLMTVTIGPAAAQHEQRGGLRTETEEPLAEGNSSGDLVWNMIGLLGLIGLIGLLPQHEEDSYHPSSFDE